MAATSSGSAHLEAKWSPCTEIRTARRRESRFPSAAPTRLELLRQFFRSPACVVHGLFVNRCSGGQAVADLGLHIHVFPFANRIIISLCGFPSRVHQKAEGLRLARYEFLEQGVRVGVGEILVDQKKVK